MHYKILGRTGLRVSIIGYGGAVLGIPYYLAREDTTDPAIQSMYTAAIERALELGINYFDTAPGYGNGVSETILGNALSTYRDRIFLTSKVTCSGTPDAIQESIEQSLRRLKTDYLDVLQFHGGYFNDREADDILNGGRLERLEQLRDSGKIRFIGITSEVPTGALERLLVTNRFDVLQICYNLTNQLACDHSRQCRGIVALAEQHHIGVVTMRTATSSFLQKLLIREFGDAISVEAVTRMCINYVLSTPEIDVALVGMRNRREVELNAALADDVQVRYDLDELHNRFHHR
ncbi:aldo/keto reductase [Candidatus Poribacteria bacterium]|nr:aldo/keto reductase [Candidatus Poribacteria bacterium]